MEHRLGSASSCRSLNAIDDRAAYHPLRQHDNLSLASPSKLRAATATNGLGMLVNGRRTLQRYKLLSDGLVQVCRVPHAKNIIEKIRFSRFLRRWEHHYIYLDHNQLVSSTVG